MFSPPQDRPAHRSLAPGEYAGPYEGERLGRLLARPDGGRNVWIAAGVATDVQPLGDDADGITAVFLGGHVPYEVTAAEKAILEAAGYTVDTV